MKKANDGPEGGGAGGARRGAGGGHEEEQFKNRDRIGIEYQYLLYNYTTLKTRMIVFCAGMTYKSLQ